MRVPLYMMSAGDLGIDPSGVESALANIMEMSAKWNAVLLLDEADVFLEKRSAHDLERNKLVSSEYPHFSAQTAPSPFLTSLLPAQSSCAF